MKFFDCWIGDIKDIPEKEEELSASINKYVKWCNFSMEFCSRSFSFFEIIFGSIFAQYDILDDISEELKNNKVSLLINDYLEGYSPFTVSLNNYFVKKLT